MPDAITSTLSAENADGHVASSPRLRAADQLRAYVEAADWSHMTYRRQQILEAFVELASTIGYQSVTMRALGERVGVKAPSIYRHFLNGRDEIVREAYRWHFYRFASAILDVVDQTRDANEYWSSLIGVHLRRQVESPENDMWDILLATDRIAGFLPDDMRDEYRAWMRLYEQMHAAVALELGCASSDVTKFVKMVVKILDTSSEWCGWDGTEEGLQTCVAQATVICRALLAVDIDDLSPGSAVRS